MRNISISDVKTYEENTIRAAEENRENQPILKKIKIRRCRFALTENQRVDLLNTIKATNKKHFLIVRTQLETGMRIGEIVHLPIFNVNFHEHFISIESYKSSKFVRAWSPKSKAGNRPVPMGNSLGDALEGFIQNRKEGYVFESNKGSCFDEKSLINMINKYARETKSIAKNIGSHVLRRTFASYMIHRNVPIEEISHALGHKSIGQTMEYIFEIQSVENFDNIRKAQAKMNPGVK